MEAEARIPPQDLAAEEAVLGALLLAGNDVLFQVERLVTPDDFYRENHAAIFGACVRLARHKEPIDNVTVAHALEQDGVLERVGGRAYLAQLQEAVPTAAGAKAYARIVHDKARLRAVIKAGESIVQKGFAPNAHPVETLTAAQQIILSASTDRTQAEFVKVGDLLVPTIERWENSGEDKAASGVSTGFYDLDAKIGGYQPGDLVVVAGRPGMGKTSFLLNQAITAATTKSERRPFGHGVAFFSLEMTGEQLVDRLLAQLARIDAARLRKQNLNEEEADRLAAAEQTISEVPIYIDDSTDLDESSVMLKTQRMVAKYATATTPIDLVIVDYIGRMKGHAKYRGDRRLEVAGISSALKDVAMGMNATVLAASQLTRDVEKRPDKRPMISDLMESGGIEADADLVLLLWRPEYYWADDPAKAQPGKAEVNVAKQRRGPTGPVWLGFNAGLTQFRNLTKGGHK